MTLYNKDYLSDVQLKIYDSTFAPTDDGDDEDYEWFLKAHKIILCNASLFFRDLFESCNDTVIPIDVENNEECFLDIILSAYDPTRGFAPARRRQISDCE